LENKKAMIRDKFVAAVLLICLFLPGCAQKDQQQDAQLQALKKNQVQEMESEKLKAFEKDIEALFEELDGPGIKVDESTSKKDKTEQEDEKQDQSEQKQDEQKQDDKKQSSNDQDKKDKKDDKQEEQKTPDKWANIDSIIRKLHFKWNELIPDLSKKGADIKLIDSFDNALNQLTTTISTKDENKVLTSANSLYSHIPDLYSIYRIKLTPETKRLIFHTRNIILESAKDNWEQVAKDSAAIEKIWSLFRNTLEDKQKKAGDKLNFSIYELKKVTAAKNKQLTDIKGRIVLENIRELQKSIDDK
jgi:hypothetical protein